MFEENKLRAFGKLIGSITEGYHMSRNEACEAYRQVILNEQPELQQGAFLIAHLMRNPSIEELSGAWDALDKYDTAKIKPQVSGPICDIVGTGSDALKTVNCSTPAALIASACGLAIAKKGARKVTGVSGATDILEAFGIDIHTPLENARISLEKGNICYLPGEAFLKSGWARLIQSMRFTSAFNILGPITSPCENLDYIVIGAYSTHVCDQLISVLKEIGIKGAVSPFGMAYKEDNTRGMDEFSTAGPTRVVELKAGNIQTYELLPEDFGVKTAKFQDIQSLENAQENAQAIMNVLKGHYDTPIADLFCANAGACLYISGLAQNYKKGAELAKEALASGKAYLQLQNLLQYQGT